MGLEPITRQEQIIAGKDLKPITRMEKFLKQYGGGSGGGAQSDWNQTDSSAADFIKNKTHYYSKKIFFNEASVPVNDGTVMFETDGVPAVGTSMNFTFNEVEYVVDVFEYSGVAAFGDLSLLGLGESNGLPFIGFWQVGTTCMLFLQFGGMASCSIKMVGQVAVKMPTEFYDRSTVFFTDMDWIYIDSSFTQKATLVELLSALNAGPVMINLYGQVFCQPSEFWTIPVYEENGVTYNCVCCKIGTNFDDNGPTDYAVLHTAEYTPET